MGLVCSLQHGHGRFGRQADHPWGQWRISHAISIQLFDMSRTSNCVTRQQQQVDRVFPAWPQSANIHTNNPHALGDAADNDLAPS
jgi:hypothetical protein